MFIGLRSPVGAEKVAPEGGPDTRYEHRRRRVEALAQQIGADRGDWPTPYSSSYLSRAIRFGDPPRPQLFQRSSLSNGQRPLTGDGRAI